MGTIPERILTNLERHPEQKAMAFVDHRGRFEWLSREMFCQRAFGIADWLEGLGLGPGDPGIIVAVDPELCATFVLAMWLMHSVPLLVAPPAIQGMNSSLVEVIRHALVRTQARLAVLPQDMAAVEADLRAVGPNARFVFGPEEVIPQAPGKTRSPSTGEESVACYQLTSGTTGLPRVCVWQHRQMLAAVDGMAEGMRLRPDDIYLNWTPLYHDMGLVNNFLLCLVCGLPLVLQSPLDVIRKPSLWLRALSDTDATITWSPNFGFAVATQRIKDAEMTGVRLDHVRGIWNAAERIHLTTMQDFYRRFKPYGVQWEMLKTNFGCTENIGGATFSDPDGPLVAERVDKEALHATGEAREAPEHKRSTAAEWIVSAGRPHPGVQIHILDPEGRELPSGRVGEVALDTTSRLKEFLGDPQATAETIRGNLVFTGDLGYKRDEELFWVGRSKERINIHGLKYDPSEFEAPLFEVAGLRKGCFAAFGVDDPVQGTQALVLIAEVDNPALRPLKAIADDIRREVAVRVGVTIGDLLLVSKGILTKTSSGKRRHTFFRELYLQKRLKALYQAGVKGIG